MRNQPHRLPPARPVRWPFSTLRSSAERCILLQPCGRDPFLLSAFLVAGLLTALQLALTLLQPAWRDQATDWLRTALAWPELLVLVLVSRWLSQRRHPEARAWWLISAGFLMYAIGQTLWGIGEQVLFPTGVPSPWWSDLGYLLQYPCFFLALTLLPPMLPGEQSGVTRVKVFLDCLLLTATATALSWYFLLAPLYRHSRQSLLGTLTTLAYPIGDLGVLFGLVLVLVSRRPVERRVLLLLVGAVTCLAIADSWSARITLEATYMGGNPPDSFWMACYLLFPLAGLVQVRLAQRAGMPQQAQPLPAQRDPATEGVVLRSLRFLLPFGVAVLAGAVIVVRATLDARSSQSPLLPFAVAGGLLLLVIARQELTFLESEHWQRQREAARRHELAALEATNRRMDAFLGVVSHELRTPLASIRWSLQAIQRHFAETGVAAPAAERPLQTQQPAIHELVTHAEGQAARLQGLIKALMEEVRLEEGQLALRRLPADLRTLVQEVVEEQRALQPERTIQVQLPGERTLLVEVDGPRIRQAVTNYLTNALAYSPPSTPVLVGVEPAEAQARLWVRDQGSGIPEEEQARVWERFYRVPGIAEQSGPAEGLGLGLYVTRRLIERHQGQVGLTSMPGQGTTFWLTLPLAPQERCDAEAESG